MSQPSPRAGLAPRPESSLGELRQEAKAQKRKAQDAERRGEYHAPETLIASHFARTDVKRVKGARAADRRSCIPRPACAGRTGGCRPSGRPRARRVTRSARAGPKDGSSGDPEPALGRREQGGRRWAG